MRLGQTLWVEPGHAAFLLPANSLELVQLEQDGCPMAMVLPVDNEFVEVRLSGSWIAQSQAAHDGMFLSVMAEQTERLLYRLWADEQGQAADAGIAHKPTGSEQLTDYRQHCPLPAQKKM